MLGTTIMPGNQIGYIGAQDQNRLPISKPKKQIRVITPEIISKIPATIGSGVFSIVGLPLEF
jgi:hypothetical protein